MKKQLKGYMPRDILENGWDESHWEIITAKRRYREDIPVIITPVKKKKK